MMFLIPPSPERVTEGHASSAASLHSWEFLTVVINQNQGSTSYTSRGPSERYAAPPPELRAHIIIPHHAVLNLAPMICDV